MVRIRTPLDVVMRAQFLREGKDDSHEERVKKFLRGKGAAYTNPSAPPKKQDIPDTGPHGGEASFARESQIEPRRRPTAPTPPLYSTYGQMSRREDPPGGPEEEKAYRRDAAAKLMKLRQEGDKRSGKGDQRFHPGNQPVVKPPAAPPPEHPPRSDHDPYPDFDPYYDAHNYGFFNHP